jgi:hypothetical protein
MKTSSCVLQLVSLEICICSGTAWVHLEEVMIKITWGESVTTGKIDSSRSQMPSRVF